MLEIILPFDPDKVRPGCVAGARACPPEDVGDPEGYARFLDVSELDGFFTAIVQWAGNDPAFHMVAGYLNQ